MRCSLPLHPRMTDVCTDCRIPDAGHGSFAKQGLWCGLDAEEKLEKYHDPLRAVGLGSDRLLCRFYCAVGPCASEMWHSMSQAASCSRAFAAEPVVENLTARATALTLSKRTRCQPHARVQQRARERRSWKEAREILGRREVTTGSS